MSHISKFVNNMEVLVVGADHYNTLWLVRSLGMASMNPICIIVSNKTRSFVGTSKFCRKCYIVPSYDEAFSLMLSLKIKNKLPVIASGDEAGAFLDEHYDELSDKYILHDCQQRGGKILYWMDKKRMLRQASDLGLCIPFTKVLQLDDSESLEGIPFPCLIKPEISALASKKNFRICNTKEELKVAILAIKDVCRKVIVQEYVHARYEYLIYGVRTKQNRIIIPGGLRKIHTCSTNSNLGMMTYACCSEFIPPQLGNFDKIKRFLNVLDYHGIFSIEFMIADDKAYFLEINLRNDGTVYCTTQAGVNIPAFWAMSAADNICINMPYSYKREKTFCMNEINYIKYTFFQQSIFKSFSEILKTKAFSLIKLDDMRPVVAKFLPFMARKVNITPPK